MLRGASCSARRVPAFAAHATPFPLEVKYQTTTKKDFYSTVKWHTPAALLMSCTDDQRPSFLDCWLSCGGSLEERLIPEYGPIRCRQHYAPSTRKATVFSLTFVGLAHVTAENNLSGRSAGKQTGLQSSTKFERQGFFARCHTRRFCKLRAVNAALHTTSTDSEFRHLESKRPGILSGRFYLFAGLPTCDNVYRNPSLGSYRPRYPPRERQASR